MTNARIAPLDLDSLRATLAAGPAGELPGAPESRLAGAAEAGPDAARLQSLGLRRVVEGAGALEDLGDVLAATGASSRDVVVLAAATPMSVGQAGLREAIEKLIGSRFAVRWVVIGPASGSVHADEQTVAAARAATAGASCVVTVGSGTITDIGKAAAGAGTALVVVQTATSVNGYADPFSVLLRDGVKRTTPTRWPDALIIDQDVLLGAPAELNRAGVGDMAAMFTATADWYLASVLRADGPPYRGDVAGLVRPHGQRMLALAGDGDGKAGRLVELARLLTLSGITMGVTGSTAPASGMEHAVSHLLEMAATATGGPANLHGTQVGVASITAAATWAHVRQRIAEGALERPARIPDPGLMQDRITSAFGHLDPTGAMAAECLADYTSKLRLLASRPDPLAVLRTQWADCDAALAALLIDPTALASGLRSAGLPVRFGALPAPVDDAAARWAVANCALQRRRFGVADLAMLLGAWEDDDVDSVLATAAGAAAQASAP
jgi:glycerol-1-phosphate dehydrogenase [NAD(P)+]